MGVMSVSVNSGSNRLRSAISAMAGEHVESTVTAVESEADVSRRASGFLSFNKQSVDKRKSSTSEQLMAGVVNEGDLKLEWRF